MDLTNLKVDEEAHLTTSSVKPRLAPIGSGQRVLMSIPSGFQLRQFVHSGVAELLLARGFKIVLLSPNRRGEGFTVELPKDGVDIRQLDFRVGPLIQRYMAVRKHLLYKGPLTTTLRESMLNLQRGYPWMTSGVKLGNRLVSVAPPLHHGLLRLEHLILRSKMICQMLKDAQIDLVLMTTPGYATWDMFLLHAAVQAGIPVVAAILSWDNISTKCFVHPQPDLVLAWSDHMRREAAELRLIPSDRIVVTGPPHYDVFANSERFGSRSENLKRLGLDPARHLIFYGTNSAAYFPDEIEVVRRVAQWVEEDALGVPCQLWVRLHPQAVAGPYKVSLDQYHGLASERVKVEFPPVRDSNLAWDLPKSDLEHLVTLFRDADVVINTASTLSIDAAILDRPVICIAYDPAGDLPYEKSVRRYYGYTHMAHVVRAGAAQLAESPEDLREKIMSYLAHPERDREGRRRIVEQQFGRVDGRAAQRVAEQVVSMALRKANSRVNRMGR